MAETCIIPPPGTLGVWADVRPLEDYDPEASDGGVRQRRGPPPRAVLACREAVLAWGTGAMPRELLPAQRERIHGLVSAAALLATRRERRTCDPFAPLEAPAVAPAHQTVQPCIAELPVPQDDFMAALAAVFG